MYCIAAMSMKDELDRLKSRAIGQYLLDAEVLQVHATKRSHAVVAQTPPTLYCSRAFARRNKEVRRTVRIRQARERDMRGRYDDEWGQAMSSTGRH